MKVVGNIASDSEVVATASGAITAGKPVVINADGTVQFAGPSSTTISAGIGSEVTFESASSRPQGCAFDSNSNKVVVTYEDTGNSSYGTAIVGTIDDSDNSISFGTAVVFESASTGRMDATFDSSNNKVVIAYKDGGNSGYGTAVVGTVSGTSISFGTPAVFKSGEIEYPTISFNTTTNKSLICYQDNSVVAKDGNAIAATVSGTSISFGTEGLFESGATYYLSSVYDPVANTHIAAFSDYGDNQYGKVCAIDMAANGDLNTQGSKTFQASSVEKKDIAYDSTNDRHLIVWKDAANNLGGGSSSGGATVVQVDKNVAGYFSTNGSSASFGTPVAWASGVMNSPAIVFNDASGTFVVLYDEASGTDVKYVEATISGTNVSFGSTAVADTDGSTDYNAVVFDSNLKRTVLLYQDSGESSYGKARVLASAGTYNVNSLTSENFIGFAKDNVADGAVATIQTANSIARDNIRDTTTSDTLGSEVGLGQNIAAEDSTSMTFDSSNNKVVVFYVNASGGDTKTVVGTVTDNSISFGTPATFTDAQYSVNALSCVFDSNENKVVFAYVDTGDSNKGKAVVGTVSGTSISFGSEVEFESGRPYTLRGTFDSNSNRVVFVYRDSDNSNYFTSVVGSVSGTSISFGTPVVIASAYYNYWDITFDSNSNKVVVGLKGASSHGQSYVGTVDSSDNSISWGSVATFHSSANPRYIGATFDTNANKVIFSYMADDDSDKGYAVVGTVSGTDISFGTPAKFEDAAVKYTSIVFNSATNKVVVVYEDDANSDYTTYAVGTVSGTDISFDTAVVVSENDANEGTSIVFDSNSNKVVMQYGHSSDGKFRVLDVAGTDTDLTIGQQYFVQTDGTLSTSADDPSVIAGTAISGTDLIVKG
jgi:hypothetical protein